MSCFVILIFFIISFFLGPDLWLSSSASSLAYIHHSELLPQHHSPHTVLGSNITSFTDCMLLTLFLDK